MNQKEARGVIEGVIIKELESHIDERGFFREILRVNEDFQLEDIGQISHSLVYKGVLKAWHLHKVQSQWNYVACGLLKVALHDTRQKSPTYRETIEFFTGDNQTPKAYFFPPGVAHGYICLDGPMHIIYITSGVYDISDEVRIPHDNPEIGYDWLKNNISE